MNNNRLCGPYEITMKVHATDGNDQVATVEVSLGCGTPPTQADIDEGVKRAADALADSGFRLMNKIEFFNAMMRERLGATERYAVPGGEEWDQ